MLQIIGGEINLKVNSKEEYKYIESHIKTKPQTKEVTKTRIY